MVINKTNITNKSWHERMNQTNGACGWSQTTFFFICFIVSICNGLREYIFILKSKHNSNKGNTDIKCPQIKCFFSDSPLRVTFSFWFGSKWNGFFSGHCRYCVLLLLFVFHANDDCVVSAPSAASSSSSWFFFWESPPKRYILL